MMCDQASFIIRTATLDDLQGFHELMEISIRQLSLPYYTEAQIEGSVALTFDRYTQLISDGTYFVICQRSWPKDIVACGGWSFLRTVYDSEMAKAHKSQPLDPYVGAAWIRGIFVHPSWKRRGLGTMVTLYCEEEAKKAGFQRFGVGSTLTATSMYEKCGYKRTSEEMARLPNEEEVVIVRMIKDLRQPETIL